MTWWPWTVHYVVQIGPETFVVRLSFVSILPSTAWFILDAFQGLKPLILCSMLVWSTSVCCSEGIMWPLRLNPEGCIVVYKRSPFKSFLTTSKCFYTCSVGSRWGWRHSFTGPTSILHFLWQKENHWMWVLIDIYSVETTMVTVLVMLTVQLTCSHIGFSDFIVMFLSRKTPPPSSWVPSWQVTR